MLRYCNRIFKDNFFMFGYNDKNIIFDFDNCNDLKVMTFNLRRDCISDKENNWENRRDRVIKMLVDYKPDVICFQEVMPHMAKWLYNVLKEYYSGYGIEIFTGGNILKSCFIYGEGLLVMWRKDLFSMVNKEVIKLFDGRKINLRRLLSIELMNKNSGEKIMILNTHFCHKSEDMRNKSWRKLYEYVNDLNCDFFACGDYNVDLSSLNSDIKLMSDKYSHNDRQTISDSSVNFFGKRKNSKIIDYIFSNKNLKYSEIITKDYGGYLSDHNPIINVYSC